MTKDFILDERARELIGEENRRMTLMRTGTLVERALRLNSNDASNRLQLNDKKFVIANSFK
jgi:hypothetical protein